MKNKVFITILVVLAITLQAYSQSNKGQCINDIMSNISKSKTRAATQTQIAVYNKLEIDLPPVLKQLPEKDACFFYLVMNSVDAFNYQKLAEYMKKNPNFRNEIKRFGSSPNFTYSIGGMSSIFTNSNAIEKFAKTAYANK